MLPSKRALSAIISIAVFLVGCKADLTANVALSELQGTPSYMDAILSVEVPSCKEYDSDFESSSLLKLKSRIPVIFPKANFLGCKSVGFDTVANFSVPIRVGQIHEECSGHDICLGSSESQPSVIFAVAGKDFISGYRKLERSESNIEPSVIIGFTNDSDKTQDLFAISLYADSDPIQFSSIYIQSKRYAELKLSNVAIDGALKGKPVPIFIVEEAK